MSTKRPFDCERCLLLKDQGYSNTEVAGILLVVPETITAWLHLYEAGGLDLLCRLETGGSEGFLNAEQTAKLIAELDQHTFQCAKQVVAWAQKQFALSYSERGMRDLLRRLGYSSQKVHLVPPKPMRRRRRLF
jgi:transposase